jgi:hypothetical protein
MAQQLLHHDLSVNAMGTESAPTGELERIASAADDYEASRIR